MRHPESPGNPEEHKGAEAELAACDRALAGGRYREAEQHLGQASVLGASPHEITQRAEAIRKREHQKAGHGPTGRTYGRSRPRNGLALLAGIAAYLLVSLQQPLGWGYPVWIALAFLVIPILVGLLIGRMHAHTGTSGEAFFAGAKAGGMAMALYTMVTLIILAARLARPNRGGEEFVAGLLVTLVFALLAGGIAGTTSLVLVNRARGRK